MVGWSPAHCLVWVLKQVRTKGSVTSALSPETQDIWVWLWLWFEPDSKLPVTELEETIWDEMFKKKKTGMMKNLWILP